MPKQSLLVAIESFFDGGAEMFAIRLANALSNHYQVHFFELKPMLSKEKKQRSLLLKHIPVIAYSNNRINKYLFQKYGHTNCSYYAKKHQILAKLTNQYSQLYLQWYCLWHRIQLVNSHSWDTDVFFATFKQQRNIQLIATLHGHYEFLAALRQQFQTQTALALQKVDAVVYTTQTHLHTLAQYYFPLLKTHKIFYGMEIAGIPKQPINHLKQPLQLIMASRGIEEKGW
ncbi:MAG: glycosyltransferase, partial [Chitinophagaceae bacterium]